MKKFILLFWLLIVGCAHVEKISTKKFAILATQHRTLSTKSCGCSMSPAGGLVREFNFIENFRKNFSEKIFIVSSGSTFVPSIMEYSSEKKADFLERAHKFVEALNDLGVNYLSPSAEDFSLGLKEIKKIEKKASFKIVSANLYHKEKKTPIFDQYLEVMINNVAIIFTGVSGKPNTIYDIDKEVEIKDPVETIASLAQSFKNKIVILLSSLDEEERLKLQNTLKDLNLIIIGSSHDVNTLSPYHYGKHQLFIAPKSQAEEVAKIIIEPSSIVNGFFDPVNANIYLNKRKSLEEKLSNGLKKLETGKLSKKKKETLTNEVLKTSLFLQKLYEIPVVKDESLSVIKTNFERLGSLYDGHNKMSKFIE